MLVTRIWPSRPWANGVTYPPFGILIKRRWWDSVGYTRRARLIRHELVHWEQYERIGLVGFWILYVYGRIRFGYKNHPMEVEARERSRGG